MPDPKTPTPTPQVSATDTAKPTAVVTPAVDPLAPQQAPSQPVQKKPAARPDKTVPGGRYVIDARVDPETGESVGGKVVDAEGTVLEDRDAEAEPPASPPEKAP